MAKKDPIDEPGTRVSIARREAADFRKELALGYFVGATLWAAVLTGMVLFGVQVGWVIVGAVVASILCIGFLIAETAKRLYIQNAYTEMTLDLLDSEVSRLHDRIAGMEVDLGKLRGESRPFRL